MPVRQLCLVNYIASEDFPALLMRVLVVPPTVVCHVGACDNSVSLCRDARVIGTSAMSRRSHQSGSNVEVQTHANRNRAHFEGLMRAASADGNHQHFARHHDQHTSSLGDVDTEAQRLHPLVRPDNATLDRGI